MVLMLATTPTNATPKSSNVADTVGALRHIVASQNACALPGCSLNYETFVPAIWEAVRTGYVSHADARFVTDGCRYGFMAGVDVARLAGHRWFNNYKSSLESRSAVTAAIQTRVDSSKTIDLGVWSDLLGAELRDYFSSSCIFPMGCVAKKLEPDKKRPTSDHTRTGLNAATCLEYLKHQLTAYDDICAWFQPGYYMHVSDVDSAFLNIPLHPDLWPYFMCRFFASDSSNEQHLFLHLFGDFGAAGMPGTFKILMDVVEGIAKSRGLLSHGRMARYVDDLAYIGWNKAMVTFDMRAFQRFCGDVCGVFFKVLKDREAADVQLVLGFWWDSVSQTRTLEEAKFLSYSETIAELAGRPSLTLQEMQSAAGKLQRCLMTFPPGAACLLVSLFTLMAGLKLPWHRRRLNKATRYDMRLIIAMLGLNLGCGYYSYTNFNQGPEVRSDACKSRSFTGGGYVISNGLYGWWPYGTRAAKQPIDYLEGDTVVEAVRRHGGSWFQMAIPFGVDNQAFERSAERGRSKAERLNVLIRELFALMLSGTFILQFYWLSSEDNVIADHFSRGRISEALQAAYETGFWQPHVRPTPDVDVGETRRLPENRGVVRIPEPAERSGRRQQRGARTSASTLRIPLMLMCLFSLCGTAKADILSATASPVACWNLGTVAPMSAWCLLALLTLVIPMLFVRAPRQGLVPKTRPGLVPTCRRLQDLPEDLLGLVGCSGAKCASGGTSGALADVLSLRCTSKTMKRIITSVDPPLRYYGRLSVVMAFGASRRDAGRKSQGAWTTGDAHRRYARFTMASVLRTPLLLMCFLCTCGTAEGRSLGTDFSLLCPEVYMNMATVVPMKIWAVMALFTLSIPVFCLLARFCRWLLTPTCILPGCQRSCFVEQKTGKVHPFCCRAHARTWPTPVHTRPPRYVSIRTLSHSFAVLLLLLAFATCVLAPARLNVQELSVHSATTSIYYGLPADVAPFLEQIMDNRLSTSSWRSVSAAMSRYLPLCEERGWSPVIATDDPMRGAKLTTFVWTLVASTALVWGSISTYVWGVRVWHMAQRQADPVSGVRHWGEFMAAIKVLTWVPSEPRRRTPIGVIKRILRAVNRAVFWEVQFAFLLLVLLNTYSRSESPCPKTHEGREAYSSDDHFNVRDFDPCGCEGHRGLWVRFRKIKQDPRVERPEARGDGDWAFIGDLDIPGLGVLEWYRLLQQFHGPRPGKEGPMFVDPNDMTRALIYGQLSDQFKEMQLRVGVPAEEVTGIHGLRVAGYDGTRGPLGEELAQVQGMWKSRAHTRYARFAMSSVAMIPQAIMGMLAASEPTPGSEMGVAPRTAGPPDHRLTRAALQAAWEDGGAPSGLQDLEPAPADEPTASSDEEGDGEAITYSDFLQRERERRATLGDDSGDYEHLDYWNRPSGRLPPTPRVVQPATPLNGAEASWELPGHYAPATASPVGPPTSSPPPRSRPAPRRGRSAAA